VDQYPNYLCGKTNHGKNLGNLVARVREWVPPEKPVWVLETGIPALPRRKRFSEALQADYYGSVLDSVQQAGGAGALFYCLVSQEGEPGNEWHKKRSWHAVENHWGLFNHTGTPREAYWMLRNRFGAKPLVRS
jgi:endo-1,4-beta-mannosidase